jgi:hypothetical protein
MKIQEINPPAFNKLSNEFQTYIDDNITGCIVCAVYFQNKLAYCNKYHGMIYTIFWKDQKSLKGKTLDDLKGEANLTIEKFLDIHNLYDFFF